LRIRKFHRQKYCIVTAFPARKPEREISNETPGFRWSILKWIKEKHDVRVRTRFKWLRTGSR
jgi:hypothetical protein